MRWLERVLRWLTGGPARALDPSPAGAPGAAGAGKRAGNKNWTRDRDDDDD